MPHGRLEVLIGGDPPLRDLGLFLAVAETVYNRLYVILESQGVTRTKLLRRLRAPARSIPLPDRLTLHLMQPGSVLLILGGFMSALTILGLVLTVVERFTKIRKNAAQTRKADAEKWYLEELAQTASVDRALSLHKLEERLERAARSGNVRAWADAIGVAQGESQRLGLDVDAKPARELPAAVEELAAALRKAGLRQAEVRKGIDDALRPTAKLKAIEIIRIELK